MAASCSCFSGSSRRVLGVSSLRPSPDRPQGAGEPPTVWGPVSHGGPSSLTGHSTCSRL